MRSLQLPTGLLRQGPHPHFDSQLDIGPDYVLSVWQDSLDVQHVPHVYFSVKAAD